MTGEIDITGAVILVADDNPNNLKVMETMLGKFGCEVRVALDGEAALKSVEAQLPDLILLDIQMPKMNGYSTCENLKADDRTRDIPVIFVSAMDDEFNKVKGFEVGAVDYIAKPVEFEEMKARIGLHLQMIRQRKSLQQTASELEALNDSMMGRELRVLELKKTVNDLSGELGREEPYPEANE